MPRQSVKACLGVFVRIWEGFLPSPRPRKSCFPSFPPFPTHAASFAASDEGSRFPSLISLLSSLPCPHSRFIVQMIGGSHLIHGAPSVSGLFSSTAQSPVVPKTRSAVVLIAEYPAVFPHIAHFFMRIFIIYEQSLSCIAHFRQVCEENRKGLDKANGWIIMKQTSACVGGQNNLNRRGEDARKTSACLESMRRLSRHAPDFRRPSHGAPPP